MASRMPALLLGLLASLTAPAIFAVEALPAAASFCLPNVAGAEAETSKVRRRPGRPIDRYELPVCDPDTTDNNAMTPWVDPLELGAPVPDRWRIVEAIGITTNLWDPYNGHNPLKGDLPVWGDDWFYSLIAISDTVLEPRRFPIPVGGATTARPGSLDTIGAGKTTVLSQSLIIENVIYKGDTVFRPPDWEFRFTPVFNINQVHAEEKGVLNVDPDIGGGTGLKRRDTFMGVQALFVDKHLRNVSDRFDFDSIRVGIQPFSSDFRGFLFQDSPFGVRLFGNRDNNRFQYNLAWFRRIEKDTNSGLNDITQALRDDDVYVANLFWQDFPHVGFFSQATLIHNRNRERGKIEYDKNGFIQRPSSLFEERFARDYDVTYAGYNGDGHIDRLNLTTSLYYAYGRQDSSRIAGADETISAFFMAAEASMDFDWLRPRLSLLWASGDDEPFDDRATGFDAIFENPQFAGADTSFVIRQNVPFIGGGGVALMGRNGILPSLRASKEQGQSNFINPGLMMLGVGADADLYPELRLSLNWNYLRFDSTAVLEALRQQGDIDKTLGQDVSVSLTWRPFMTQNIVVRLSAAGLLPGQGFDDLYGREAAMPYSVLANIILTY
ncbi:MAG: hypothetical protein NWR61_03550 [Pseudomonadales bacterium]|nr:hypothetical protein [Pseudomonadales bacterium]MDP4640080.1 hypothetical protein [Pseudomonadales bacterium]MDP4765405.1 hypothetical protein [Pseudomonadales bacterium]MDP4910776.1 hypothetical protein [Pseudomonadales bacterium]MDP5059495.1 hypothetical protein [Pseudomonadales bacterium]